MPNGAFGTWTTKKSNSVSGGRPVTRTRIFSTGPRDLTSTSAAAFGRQPAFAAAVDRTMWKSISFSRCCAWAGIDTATPDRATPVAAAAASARQWRRARCMTRRFDPVCSAAACARCVRSDRGRAVPRAYSPGAIRGLEVLAVPQHAAQLLIVDQLLVGVRVGQRPEREVAPARLQDRRAQPRRQPRLHLLWHPLVEQLPQQHRDGPVVGSRQRLRAAAREAVVVELRLQRRADRARRARRPVRV